MTLLISVECTALRALKVERAVGKSACRPVQQVECVTLDVKTYQDSTGKAVDSEQVAAAVVQLVHDTRCSNCLVWAKTDEVVSLIKALSPG
ncbi:GP-PDE domain-containing protein [Haematococcus lacustris]|uniref:GP-PDE domain-containing protein n=1 Tax=Haematococcus lacustris TaxID=44745 RepID=A0A699YJH4_HAELA|nr:GP-PDE domain-containing protein [Haematococcus lacustris]